MNFYTSPRCLEFIGQPVSSASWKGIRRENECTRANWHLSDHIFGKAPGDIKVEIMRTGEPWAKPVPAAVTKVPSSTLGAGAMAAGAAAATAGWMTLAESSSRARGFWFLSLPRELDNLKGFSDAEILLSMA